jgi:Na+-driven multidrug efflux pump
MLSLLRDFVLSVPLVLLLPIKFGIIGPLFSAPIADVVSFIVTVILIRYTVKHLSK